MQESIRGKIGLAQHLAGGEVGLDRRVTAGESGEQSCVAEERLEGWRDCERRQ